MLTLKLFMFHSLAVTTGLFLYTFFLYMMYRLFYKEDLDDPETSMLSEKEQNLDETMDDLESIPDVTTEDS